MAGLRACLRFSNRFSLIFHRLLFPAERLLVYRLDTLEFLVDHDAGDPAGTRDVLLSPMYRVPIARAGLFRDTALNVLDLGANGGGFLLLLRAEGYTLGRAVAVELNGHTAARLRFNLERNMPGVTNVLVAAVNGDGRSVDVALSTGGTGDSIYRPSKNGLRRTVSGITLDSLAAHFGNETIDIIKMDVEGAETEVLLGQHCHALARTRALIVEIHNPADVEPIARRLGQCGLKMVPERVVRGDDVYLFKRADALPAQLQSSSPQFR
jgi:methyltransferase, FkbM family